MKNIIKTVIGGAIVSLGLFSCNNDDFDTLNVDPKHATELPSDNLLASQFNSAVTAIYTPSVNGNNFRFFVQQLAETTYTDETQYDLTTRNQPRNFFNSLYTSGINRLKLAKEALEKEVNDANVKNNKWVTLELQELFLWETLVDTYGNLPYSQAFKSDEFLAPKYDDASTIYKDLIKRIDVALSKIDTSAKGYASGDFIYHGDMSKWKKFGNSLKLRLGVNLADVEPALSKSTVESAVGDGVMTSDTDSYSMVFDGVTFSNPIYNSFVASGRDDFIPTEFVVNMMNTNNDPRRAVWFTQVNGAYKGGVFGNSNDFTACSHYTSVLTAATAPAKLLSYTEVAFLLAESSARGYNVGGNAEDFYKKAVKASMMEYGVSDGDATAYLTTNAYDSGNWKKSIGEQAYIALFDRAFATWNFTRRLDFPVLVNRSTSLLPTVPFRMPYSDKEYQLNNTNVEAAAKAIGGDKAETKLFWDKN